ncbi:unnamed protein product [Rhizophagus irregularis]|uniref:Uncharacterized protein n=1 Tax=Rhizophagus irregularis TaxID=588596 RepID=A0A915Z7V8_9GLOM|nr:unnamed protein product [Rhizophagus irregularis]
MSKFDKYFDDLTSCSLISFLEHKLPTNKKKAYSLYKGTLSSIAKDVDTEQDRRVTARACMDAFKGLCAVCVPLDQSKSEVVKQYWTKRELENKIDIEENLHILDATKDVRVQGRFLRKIITKKLEKRSGFEDNEEDPGKDLSDKVDSFFKSPAEEKSSNLFLKKLQKSKDETDNEEGKINHRAEKHKRDKSSRCSDCDMEINIYELMRYCPYCGSKIMSFEVESDLEALDDEQSDEESVADDVDEDEDTPPKVDKVAFRMAYGAIPNTSKLRLSTGKIVEDVLFKFAKDMDYEHHAHSYIVDFDDENVKALFTDEEWKELTEDRIGVPSVPSDIVKEMARYGKKTVEELRITVMTTYLKDKERYDICKHFNQEWVQMTMRTLCNLYENELTLREQMHHRVDRKLEIGAIEAARSFLGVSDRKYLLEAFKMPKTLRDMYTDLMIAANYEQQKADKLQVVGIIHLGTSFNVDSKFSKEAVKSFLKLLVAIYQHKLIIKDNLQVLDIRNNNDNESQDDLENELMEASQISAPISTVEFFADNTKTPRKSKKKKPVKKRRLNN